MMFCAAKLDNIRLMRPTEIFICYNFRLSFKKMLCEQVELFSESSHFSRPEYACKFAFHLYAFDVDEFQPPVA